MKEDKSSKKNRVAAIVIHGIGEQKPMETMSDFVKSILAYEEYKGYILPEQNYYSAPEEIEGSFETQRWIVMPTKYRGKRNPNLSSDHSGNYIASDEKDQVRPMMDFYELYWAPLMNDNKFSHVIPWLINLIRSKNKPSSIKTLLKGVYWLVLILFAAAVLSSIGIHYIVTRLPGLQLLDRFFSDAIVTISILLIGNLLIKLIRWLLIPGVLAIFSLAIYGIVVLINAYFNIEESIFKYVYSGLLFSLIINSVFYKFSGSLLKNWLADAARYFSPTPDNIAQRNAIRNKGVELLETLTKRNKYDRIIVVGHSLGSAVGYDILRLYWAKHCNYYQVRDNVTRILGEMDDINKFDSSKVCDYQLNQSKGFYALKENDIEKLQVNSPLLPWLVSDFITLGSPLSKFTLLLADGDIKKMWATKNERTTVINPPQIDSKSNSYYYKHPTGPRLHHGALFAFTRWTNIYHENDHIGGKIDSQLGSGNLNIKIATQKINSNFDKKLSFLNKIYKCITANSIAMHTQYWSSNIMRDDMNGMDMANPILEDSFKADLAFGSIDEIYRAMHFNLPEELDDIDDCQNGK